MALATVEDVERRYGQALSDEERDQVGVLLDDAEAILAHRVPNLLEKSATDENYRRLVVMVEVNMVLRVLKNPSGYTQELDGNYSYSISAKTASGYLEIGDDELGWLGVSQSVFLLSPQVPGMYDRYGEGSYNPWNWSINHEAY